MTKAKRKLLPKDFEALLRKGDHAAVKAVFDVCGVDARGGYCKQSALAFNDLPDDLARWLIEQGADIAAPDSHGETPLHARAGHWQGRIDVLLELGADVEARNSGGNTPLHRAAAVGNAHTTGTLLAHGARHDAVGKAGLTPLAFALQQTGNTGIEGLAAVAALLLDATAHPAREGRTLRDRIFGHRPKKDAAVTPEMKARVREIGANFEFHRSGYNPDSVEAVSAALDRLYALFEVPPAPRRAMHDGKATIIARAGAWEDRHDELWALLVPSSGAANTVQGEVIRISGRMHIEINENGGINWDDDYRKMGKALLDHIASGTPLPDAERATAAALVAGARRGDGDIGQLCKLAVDWVELNPVPIALPPPDYRR